MLVSVYIPTRNRLSLLKKAVESVISQTYSELEIIVVNDASDDGTTAYLEAIVSTDRRVKLITNTAPRGAPASRNRAIQAARGEFVTGLDDDDAFENYRIETFVRSWQTFEAAKQKTSLLYAQEKWFIGTRTVFETKKRGSVEANDLAASNQIGNQAFAPKSVYLESGLFDESLPAWQDLELFIRILRRFGSGRLVDVTSYCFDVSPRLDRISSDSSKVRSAYRMVVQKHFVDQNRHKQQLMLQVFGKYYNFIPTVSDFWEFLSLGFWPEGLYTLAKARFSR